MEDYSVHAEDDYKYAEMQFIVTKKLQKPALADDEDQTPTTTGECAFIDGVTSDLYNSCTIKIDKMTAGKYLCFYTAKFGKKQLSRKINVIFYGKNEVKMRRISAKQFGSGFFDEILRLNF